MLHRLFSSFDALAEQHGVLKVNASYAYRCCIAFPLKLSSTQVETIGDAYIAATNIRNNQVLKYMCQSLCCELFEWMHDSIVRIFQDWPKQIEYEEDFNVVIMMYGTAAV